MQKIFQKRSVQDKNDLLSPDLQNVEARIDLIKQVCHNVGKKLMACLQGPGATDADKTLKKIPVSMLSKTLIESGAAFSNDDALGRTFSRCGEAQRRLAKALMNYEADTEKTVLEPIQNLLEKDIPTINKLRKQLTKQAQELESIKSRFQSQQKQTTSTSQQQSAASKIEGLREEMEDAQMKLEQYKDQLATEMYIFIANEFKLNEILLQLIESQVRYHRNVLTIFKEVMPQLRHEISAGSIYPVYGRPLEEHLSRTKRTIASVVEESILALDANGLDEEGLFRISSGASRVRKLRAAFDADMVNMSEFVNDPHCITGCLKQYLRELPEPLMTFNLYDDWVHTMKLPADQRVNALKIIVARLPEASFENLRYLIKFASKISKNSSVNKMTTNNLAIVFGPTLLWSPQADEHSMSGVESAIVEVLISNADDIFPIDINFSHPFSMPTSRASNRNDVTPVPSRHAPPPSIPPPAVPSPAVPPPAVPPPAVPDSATIAGTAPSRIPPNVPFVQPLLDIANPAPAGGLLQPTSSASALAVAGMSLATSGNNMNTSAPTMTLSSGFSCGSSSGSVVEISTTSGPFHPVAAPRRTLDKPPSPPTTNPSSSTARELDSLAPSSMKSASSDNSLDKLDDGMPFPSSPATRRATRKSAAPPPPVAIALARESESAGEALHSTTSATALQGGHEPPTKPTTSNSLFAAKQALIGGMLERPKIKTLLKRPDTEYEKVSAERAEEKHRLSQTNEDEDDQIRDDLPKTRVVENKDMVVESMKKPRNNHLVSDYFEDNGHITSDLRRGSNTSIGKDGTIPQDEEVQHISSEVRKKPERPAKPARPSTSTTVTADSADEKSLKITRLSSDADTVGEVDPDSHLGKSPPQAQARSLRQAPVPTYSDTSSTKTQLHDNSVEERPSTNGVDAKNSLPDSSTSTTSNSPTVVKPPKPPPPNIPGGQKPRESASSEGDVVGRSTTKISETVEHHLLVHEEDTYF